MAPLPIRIFPDPVLREKCLAVTRFNSELHKLLDDMRETMYLGSGIGLAASQVGTLLRVAVIDISGEGKELIEFINPEITSKEGEIIMEEGCLSIPDFREKVTRNSHVTVEALDRNGKPFKVEADEILAVCIQHEIDHLNGVLFVDHLSRLKREIFRRWLKKRQRSD